MAEKQGWRVSVALAGIGILGALLGNAYSNRLAVRREIVQRQSEAYVAFLGAFEKYRMSMVESNNGNPSEADRLMRDFEIEGGAAARRIAVFGDVEVVKALANRYRDFSLPACEERIPKTELAVWESMRSSLFGSDVSSNDFAAAAGRCNPVLPPGGAAQQGVAADGAAPRR